MASKKIILWFIILGLLVHGVLGTINFNDGGETLFFAIMEDSGGVVDDKSPNGNDLTIIGSPSLIDGASGFTATDHFYTQEPLGARADDRAFCVWFNTSAGQGSDRVLVFAGDGVDGSKNSHLNGIRISGSGNVQYVAADGGATNAGSSYIDGTIYLHCGNEDSDTWTNYIDNAIDGSGAIAGSAYEDNNLFVGVSNDSGGTPDTEATDVTIWAVYVFNKSISLAEYQALNAQGHTYNPYPSENGTNFTTITAKNLYNDSSIQIFNITLSNSTHNITNITQSGSAVFANLTGLYNLSFVAPSYFPNITYNFNGSTSAYTVYAIPYNEILNVSYSNFFSNDSYNYTSNLTYSINASCDSSEATNVYLYADGVLAKTSSFGCTNASVIESYHYTTPTEGTKFYEILMSSPVTDYGNLSGSNFTFDLFNPNVSISYSMIPDFADNNATINMTCEDTTSGYLNYNLTINGESAADVNLSASSVLSISYEMVNNNNSIVGICTDLVGHSTTRTYNPIFYIGNLTLVEELTGDAYDESNLSRVVAIIENGTTYDFKAMGTNTIRISSGESNTKIRVELEHSDGTVITRHIDWELVGGNVEVCANYDEQTYQQQIIVSATQKAVFIKNTFTDCYLDADYTRFAYEDALILPSYTIESLYYIETYIDDELIILASLDGSIAASINIDQLEFNRQAYNLNILGETLVFEKSGTNEITIFFKSLSGDNTDMDLTIRDMDTGATYLSVSPTNPNNFTIIFDYSLLGLTNESLLKIELNTINANGQTNTIKKYFTPQMATGTIPPALAITISILLTIFGLTTTIPRITFGWLGIFITLCAIAILSLAIQEWYTIFIMGMELILLVFIILKMVSQNYPEVA